MGRNTRSTKAEQLTADRRRQLLARLILRGGLHLSTRDLADKLAKMKPADPCQVNGKGKPWDHTTIFRDLQVIQDQWQDATIRDTTATRAQQVAELREGRADLWADKKARSHDRANALARNLALEARLTGTEAPAKVAPVTPDGTEPYATDAGPNAAGLAELLALIDAAGTRTRPAAGAKPDRKGQPKRR